MDVARMSEAHVPEPATTEGPSRQDLLRIYEQTRTIAVVGASADERKAAHVIPSYLQSQGYRISPVNPKGGEIFGEHVYPSLEEIDAPVDVVDVFRPPAEAETIARQATRSAPMSFGSSLERILQKPSSSPPMRG
jgi:predicted CoA-binding protein